MHPNTRKALEEEIEFWKEFATKPNKSDLMPAKRGLCNRYLKEDPDKSSDDGRTCYGCPVKNKMGKPRCEDTPYVEFINHVLDKHADGYQTYSKGLSRAKGCAQCTKLIKQHIKLLESILPKKRGK